MNAVSKLNSAASLMGRKGGASKSPAKRRASRANGKLGGRPRQFPRCPRYGAHRFSPTTSPVSLWFRSAPFALISTCKTCMRRVERMFDKL